jgi:sirohydrochlorin cobaltochelatase
MEQGHLLGRNEPLSRIGSEIGLLLAAHGERGEAGAGEGANASVIRLADELRARGIVAEVRCGFIKGAPTIRDALAAFTTPDIVVYPLFLAEGFFTRVRLPELIGAADAARPVTILPPLGADPALVGLVMERAIRMGEARGYAAADTWLVLVAHGSATHTSSRRAADHLARRIAMRWRFAGVTAAFLEEVPLIDDVLRTVPGPAVVAGLFAGEGLHGREDLGRLIAAADRSDLAPIGNVGTWPELADIVTAALRDVAPATALSDVPRPATPAPLVAGQASASR